MDAFNLGLTVGRVRRRHPWQGFTICAVALALAPVASCSRGTVPSDAAEGRTAQAQSSAATLPAVGPLEQALGFDVLTPVTLVPEYQAHLVETENLVAQCMKDAGFEYIPWPVAEQTLDLGSSDNAEPGAWGSLDYRRQFGYGVSTSPAAEPEETPTDQPNPNDALVAALSSAEQQAWREAYQGTDMGYTRPVTMSDGTETTVYNWEDAGCVGAARHEVLPHIGGSVLDHPQFGNLAVAIAEMDTAFRSSSALSDIYGDWSSCMKVADLRTPLPTFLSIGNDLC